MKQNYKAWEIKLTDFPKQASSKQKLSFLLNFATLAPSSHNSQPWKFEVGDDYIIVKPDFRRALKASDENNRQLYLSLGCAIENILVAADYFGYATEKHFLQISKEEIHVKINFSLREEKISHENLHLANAILTRISNRNAYKEDVPHDFIKNLAELNTADFHIHAVDDKQQRENLAHTFIDAMVVAMGDKDFCVELAKYLRPNNTSEYIGMPGFTLGMPHLMSLIAPKLILYINMAKMGKSKELDTLINHTPVFLLGTTKEDNEMGWLNAGMQYEKISLMATQAGLSVSTMASAIQMGEFYKDVQGVLKTDFRPQFFMRLGYSKDTKAIALTPRLLAKDTIE